MKRLLLSFCHVSKAIAFVSLLLIYTPAIFSQITNRVRRDIDREAVIRRVEIRDTSPINKAILRREIRVNPALREVFASRAATDTVWDATPFLQSKENCDFEKSVDSTGCVIVKYSDGLIKKICNGRVTEVITPDGKKHVVRVSVAMMYVMPIPPPPNPQQSDNSYHWISRYNDALLEDIKLFIGINNETALNEYLTRERKRCEGNLYKQIEYRTIFIEEFLKAK